MSVADSGPDISISNAERRYANVSPLLLVLKYQQQVLSSLSALLGALFAIGFAVVGAIWAFKLVSGSLPGQGLALEAPGGIGVMHWALFAVGWVANARIVGRLAAHLELDAAEAARLAAAPPAKNRRAETVLGFFLDRDGRLRIVRSASYRHLAYLLTIRLFLRQKLQAVALGRA